MPFATTSSSHSAIHAQSCCNLATIDALFGFSWAPASLQTSSRHEQLAQDRAGKVFSASGQRSGCPNEHEQSSGLVAAVTSEQSRPTKTRGTASTTVVLYVLNVVACRHGPRNQLKNQSHPIACLAMILCGSGLAVSCWWHSGPPFLAFPFADYGQMVRNDRLCSLSADASKRKGRDASRTVEEGCSLVRSRGYAIVQNRRLKENRPKGPPTQAAWRRRHSLTTLSGLSLDRGLAAASCNYVLVDFAVATT
jgi:hypothetical protein